MIAQPPHPGLICVAATGREQHRDLDAAAEHGVEVRNGQALDEAWWPETTLGAKTLLLRMVYYDEFFKSGRYARSAPAFCFDCPIRQLHGRRWGVIGQIGRSGAAGCGFRLRGELPLHVGRRTRGGLPSALPLDELPRADVVSIHCPLNAHTREAARVAASAG